METGLPSLSRSGIAGPAGILLLLLVYLAALPSSRAPIKDEGGYYRVAAGFGRYGLGMYEEVDMTSSSLSLVVGAHLLMSVAGRSLPVARAYVLGVCFLGLAMAFWMIRRRGEETPGAALAFVGIVAVNPLFARYAHTFTTDGVFVAFCLLSLLLYAEGTETMSRGALALGSAAAALAIYTRQPGVVLPVVPLAVYGLQVLRKQRPLRLDVPLLLALPYLAFLPLALFFHRHSGSFLMYISKPYEHELGGPRAGTILWYVTFLGFFAAPFAYQILRRHGALLLRHGGAPLALCLVLTPLVLLDGDSFASAKGGLGRIFEAAHLPGGLAQALGLFFLFCGFATLAILAMRALAGSTLDLYFLLFSALYILGMSTKGGNLLVHYAVPLVPAVAWVGATSFGRDYRGGRAFFVVCLAVVALFSGVWAKAESTLGDAIHEAVRYVEQNREPGELTYALSGTAIYSLGNEHVTFGRDKASFAITTPEDLPAPGPGDDFVQARVFDAPFCGLSVGKVRVFERR